MNLSSVSRYFRAALKSVLDKNTFTPYLKTGHRLKRSGMIGRRARGFQPVASQTRQIPRGLVGLEREALGTKTGPSLWDWRRQDNRTIRMGFETVGTPPVLRYEFMAARGWLVDVYYIYTDLKFCGKFTSEKGVPCKWSL